MFTDNPNLTQLGEKAFVYKNFIDQKTVEKINNFYDNQPRENFNYPDHPIEWYADKVSRNSNQLIDVWNKVSDFLYPDHVIPPTLSLLIMEPGDEPMFVHSDSPGEGNHDKLISDDGYDTCPLKTWGIVVYFGDFEGGEIFYPNFDLEYLKGNAYSYYLSNKLKCEKKLLIAYMNLLKMMREWFLLDPI